MTLIDTSASHKIYGIPQTINTANYAYFLAYKELFALRSHVQSQATKIERPQRLIDDTELDRLVTGACYLVHNVDYYATNSQRRCCVYTEDRVLSSYGEIRYSALQKRSTCLWSTIVRAGLTSASVQRFTVLALETGGLFRVAVKLMMACATTNVDVYVE